MDGFIYHAGRKGMNGFMREFVKIKTEIPLHPQIETLKSILRSRVLILYGAGAVCSAALNFCEAKNIKVAFICDSTATGTYGNTGLTIISPHRLVMSYAEAIVMITSWRFEKEIFGNLIKMGFKREQICLFRPYFMTLNNFNENFLSGYIWAYDFFKDTVSKKLILDKTCSYLLNKPILPTSQYEKIYYDDDVITLGDNESFLDAGAYTGDTVQIFIKHVNNKFSHIWAFEPDTANYEQAVRNLSMHPNVDILHKGLWSSEAKLQFYGAGERDSTCIPKSGWAMGFSFVNQSLGKYIGAVTSLDVFFSGNKLPTFIKMDIEGAEKAAITGTADIIRRVKPRFAIAADHNPGDIYELPQIISAIRDDYCFVLRQYDYGFTKTVLYAV